MKYLTTFLILALALGALLGLQRAAPASAATIPTISILAVEADKTVTIQTHNYPANTKFDVRMGRMGTRGVKGVLVTTIDSGKGGTFTATFDIPKEMQGQRRIAIRLESSRGFFSYNWFWNNTSGGGSSPGTGTPRAPYTGIPTIKILSVTRDQSIVIETNNYPANLKFDVRMGRIGTRGVNGIFVTTIDSGTGGTFQATVHIPKELHGQSRIAIRLESTPGYYSYNWFWNSTTGSGSGAQPPATKPPTTPTSTPSAPTGGKIPTITILAVERDKTVTIQTHNYPANVKFDVRMGRMGTRGVNGALVTTIDSGKGGTFTATFDIPSSLHGLSRIAIRLESAPGYYSYNWFYNNTTN